MLLFLEAGKLSSVPVSKHMLHFGDCLFERYRCVRAPRGECYMFDVYVNVKQDRLLVVARGQPVPIIENAGQWRKK